MRVFLAVLLLIFSLQSWTKADDIRDFEIEGMSIGDSLLDYLSKIKIKDQIETSKYIYENRKPKHKFGEVYIYNNEFNFDIYEIVSFFVKPNDSNYKIYFIRGMLKFIEDFEGCLNKQKKIAKDVESIINDFEKEIDNFKPYRDPSGESVMSQIKYEFNNGDSLIISCSDWEENLRNKNNWTEGISVVIQTNEFRIWNSSHYDN